MAQVRKYKYLRVCNNKSYGPFIEGMLLTEKEYRNFTKNNSAKYWPEVEAVEVPADEVYYSFGARFAVSIPAKTGS